MKNKFVLLFIAIVFAMSFLAGLWLKSDPPGLPMERIHMQYEACNPVQNACEAVLGNGRVSLSFLQQPTALKPFDIEIRIENIDVDEVVLDFRMESMNMGINLYRLRQVADGLWKATVMLPVCTSRRSDWVGEVQVQHAGKIWFAEYRFGLLRE